VRYQVCLQSSGGGGGFFGAIALTVSDAKIPRGCDTVVQCSAASFTTWWDCNLYGYGLTLQRCRREEGQINNWERGSACFETGVAAVAALGGRCLDDALQTSGKKGKGLGKAVTAFGMERSRYMNTRVPVVKWTEV